MPKLIFPAFAGLAFLLSVWAFRLRHLPGLSARSAIPSPQKQCEAIAVGSELTKKLEFENLKPRLERRCINDARRHSDPRQQVAPVEQIACGLNIRRFRSQLCLARRRPYQAPGSPRWLLEIEALQEACLIVI